MRALPREGPYLLCSGFGLTGLSVLCGTAHWKLGAGQYPVWLPLAIDAVIALAAGAVLVLMNERFEEPGDLPSDEFVQVKRAVWESVQSEVVAARSTGLPTARGVTPPPAGLAASPAVVHPWDEGPPIPPEPQPLPPVPAVSPPPPAPIPTLRPDRTQLGPSRRVIERVSAAKSAVRSLTTQELEEIDRLGSILGFEPQKKTPTKGSSSPPPSASRAPDVPVPAPGSAAPKRPVWSEEGLPTTGSEAPDIDELMQWLENMEDERGPIPPPSPPEKPREKKGTDGAAH